MRRVKDYSVLTGHPNRLLLRVVVKGQRAAEQCVDDAAKRPQVTLKGVWFLFEDLGSDVSKSAERLHGALVWSNHFRKAKVDEFGHRVVRGVRHHDVFQLEVSVHDSVAVQVLNAEGQLVGKLADPVLS